MLFAVPRVRQLLGACRAMADQSSTLAASLARLLTASSAIATRVLPLSPTKPPSHRIAIIGAPFHPQHRPTSQLSPLTCSIQSCCLSHTRAPHARGDPTASARGEGQGGRCGVSLAVLNKLNLPHSLGSGCLSHFSWNQMLRGFSSTPSAYGRLQVKGEVVMGF